MKATIILVFLIGVTTSYAQGIRFADNLTWTQVQVNAKTQHKNIFMDVYATWCGPCKFMADSVFTKTEAGNYMNERFICYKVQIDQTTKDSPAIKAKYIEAKQLAEKYQVTGFPTLLFFSPDGVLIDKSEGGFQNATGFIEKAKRAIDPREQYYNLLEQYYAGEQDKPFLIRLMGLAETVNDSKTAAEINKKLHQM